MAEKTTVQFGENSPEHVAYKLMLHISNLERKSVDSSKPGNENWSGADRKWILDTYAECLKAVRDPYAR